MEKIFEFISANWQYISICIVIVIEVLIVLIKKRPVKIIDTITQSLLQLLPEFIISAEARYPFGHGQEKKDLVLHLVEEWFKYNNLEFTNFYRNIAVRQIEVILSTPQKKKGE